MSKQDLQFGNELSHSVQRRLFSTSTPLYPAVIPLASLNGINGFKLDGEKKNDQSGISVSAAGDINGDGHPDLLVTSSSGNSCVIFGGSGVGNGGLIPLSGLNGNNGFEINGGSSISGIGDINGDNYNDLLIGDPGNGGYVVFGGPGVGSGGLVSLSGLNGSKGFALQYESAGNIGISVSGVGDINGDGRPDLLIGAPGYGVSGASGAGRSYVVFGDDTSPQIVANQLNINHGQTVVLTTNNLNAVGTVTPITFSISKLTLQNLQGSDSDITFNVGSLTFSVSQVQHGQFGLVADPSQPITQFTQAQISAGQIEFIQDGTPSTPSYQVLLTDGRLDIAQSADVSFDTAPVFINNRLTISPGQIVVLAITDIRVIDTNTGDSGLIFTPQNVQHGQFISLLNPGVTLTNFTQAQISDAEIEFVADGSDQAPSYTLTVVDAVDLTATENAQVVFNLSSSTVNNSNTVRNAIIGAVLSGVISSSDSAQIELMSHRGNIFSEAQELSQMKSRMLGLEKQVTEHAKRLDDLESRPLLSNS